MNTYMACHPLLPTGIQACDKKYCSVKGLISCIMSLTTNMCIFYTASVRMFPWPHCGGSRGMGSRPFLNEAIRPKSIFISWPSEDLHASKLKLLPLGLKDYMEGSRWLMLLGNNVGRKGVK